MTRAGQHWAEGVPASCAVTGFFAQLPLHGFQGILSVFQGAGGEFEQAGLNGKAVLTQQHHLAVVGERHSQ